MGHTDRAALIATVKQLWIDANRLCDRQIGGTYESDCRLSLKQAEPAIDAIAALLEAEAWQPIATAPKPDAKVLGWCPYRHIKDPDFRVAVMWWREKYKRWCSAENDSFVTDEEDGPTHWRPLPAPPVTEAKL